VSANNEPLVTVYRYETTATPTVTVHRTRGSILTLGGIVLKETARQVPRSEVTASGLWEPARILAP